MPVLCIRVIAEAKATQVKTYALASALSLSCCIFQWRAALRYFSTFASACATYASAAVSFSRSAATSAAAAVAASASVAFAFNSS